MSDLVLIPLDGSEASGRVIESLRLLLQGREVRFLLLGVAPQTTPAEQEDTLDQLKAHLDRVQADFAKRKVQAEIRLERGDPADRILAVAEEVSPSLIAMTTHGRSGLQRLVRGSVAERVLRHARVPLLLATPNSVDPDQGTSFRRILVPLDGSERSDAILPQVELVARSCGATVVLLRVEPFLYSALPSPALHGMDTWNADATRASLDPARDRLVAAGIEVEIRAAYGVEAAEILQAAEDVDLVAMTTHGRSGPSRWLFGSVAESVIRHCERPLLVVRQQD